MNEKISQYITDVLANDTLEIHYQSQFCLVGGCFEVTGAEALIRPDVSVCHTKSFLDTAISSNQINELGYYVIGKAVRQLRDWIDQNLVSSTFSMSINVAGEQLDDDEFCEKIVKIVADADIRSVQVTLELIESSMINDVNITKIYQLAAKGFKISIDDFGTGYSSFGRLKLLPVHEIKIDKMFVDDITKTDQDLALLTAMYQLTRALNKFTIVEGVENEQQYDMLRDIGFTCFQGYFFSMAEEPQEFEQTISLINSLHYRPCLR
jgi:EAL domain-containing protein (putative c-di-GMP-specific phosphodiesterase class I)